jgi:photosystem II stability/assembly factor-like uncharacterized protein
MALVLVTSSACSQALGRPASTPTPTPATTPSATLRPVGSPVPGILGSPSPPVALPTEASLSAASSNVVWVLVQSQFLYRSTNRGITWQQRPIPPGNFPWPEISFIDDQQGWFTTGGVPETQCNGAGTAVWRTVDGGSNWQQVASVDWQHDVQGAIGYRQCKRGLSFVDATHGFLGASDPNHPPTIYRTVDGGLTWAATTLADPPGYVTLGAGDTLSLGLAKAFGNTILLPAWGMQPNAQREVEYIFRSVDGGVSWTYIATAGQGIDTVTLVTESRWLRIANDASALETTDAGKTWHPYRSDYQDAAGVSSVFVFGNPLVGYGTVRGGIKRTVDGGQHWTSINTPGVG